MDKKKTSTVLVIVSIVLTAAGIVFLLVSIFGDDKRNWVLCSALFCILLSNLFHFIRVQLNKKQE